MICTKLTKRFLSAIRSHQSQTSLLSLCYCLHETAKYILHTIWRILSAPLNSQPIIWLTIVLKVQRTFRCWENYLFEENWRLIKLFLSASELFCLVYLFFRLACLLNIRGQKISLSVRIASTWWSAQLKE